MIRSWRHKGLRELHEAGRTRRIRPDLQQRIGIILDAMPKKRSRPPTHPGALLREIVLPALGVTVSQAARDMQVSRQQLHKILAEERSVTADMAARLGRYCGNGPELWLNMQSAYDLWQAERRLSGVLKAIPVRASA